MRSDPLSESVGTLDRFDPVLTDSAELMQTLTGRHGVDICDRYYFLRKYKACFQGNDLVDLFVARYRMSRRQAVRAGQRILSQGLICHVTGDHDFKDEPLFYAVGSVPESGKGTEEIQLSYESLVSLVHNMRGPDGINVGTRRHWLVDYPECFVASEAVSWIATHTRTTPDEAKKVGRALLQSNLIRHVFDEMHFEDGNHLYRFV